jgi:hypothetical protein
MSEISFYKKPEYIKAFSDKLRKTETKAEKLLRDLIKNKKID